MNKDDLKNISNLKVSNDCYKSLKKIGIDKEITIQKVVQEILERGTTKKNKNEASEEA